MARRPDLEVFAREHGLKIGTIADLIHYRVQNEKTVERVNECQLATAYGDFRLIAFQDVVDREVHLALVKGEPSPGRPVLVRVHVQNSICDLFDTVGSGCGWPLRHAMQQINEAGEGVVVVLRNHDSAREVARRIQAKADRQAEQAARDQRKELRTLGVGAQILADLGIRKMRVMSAPISLHGLNGFDLEVVEFVDHS